MGVDMAAYMDKDAAEDDEVKVVIMKKTGSKMIINGINSINILDPTQSFTAQEWEALRYNGGQAYVMQARERMNSHGG